MNEVMADVSKAGENIRSGQISSIRKRELIRAWHVIDAAKVEHIDGRNFLTGGEVEVRVYMARGASASVMYAIAWIRDNANSHWYSGSDSAGGGGYDKESAAIAGAISDAGIFLYDNFRPYNFGGSGEGSTETALLAIAKAIGISQPVVIKSYA